MSRAVALVLAVLVCVYGRACRGARVDELFRARCASTCITAPKKMQCESKCSLVTTSKPGECPIAGELSLFEDACIASCSQDRDCAATDKCCANQCGRTCQHAVGLDRHPGLPGVPVNVTVSETRRTRSKVVRWAVGPSSTPAASGHVLYVLQERRYLGESLQPQLFGAWRARNRRRHTRVVLSDLTPAYWYQVRVAAVNGNGTQGFSVPSPAFKLDAEPNKPGEPRNLTMVRPGWVKGKLWIELRWRRPPSDIPLHHYKVSWSHCVKVGYLDNPDTDCKANSVIVHHKSVNYKSTYFILTDLEPNSLYFIQVQAVTVLYGLKKKLSSETAGDFIYTNDHKNATYNWKAQPQNSVKHLRISRFYRTNTDGLEAKVTWDSAPGRFLIKWAPSASCETVSNKPSYHAITEDLHYDLDHLTFVCKYQVSVTAISSSKSAKITFSTPLCTEVSPKLPCVS